MNLEKRTNEKAYQMTEKYRIKFGYSGDYLHLVIVGYFQDAKFLSSFFLVQCILILFRGY